jgi:hypothetical protein
VQNVCRGDKPMGRLFALAFLLVSIPATSQDSAMLHPQPDSAVLTQESRQTQDAVPRSMPLDLAVAGSDDSQSGCPVHILRLTMNAPLT